LNESILVVDDDSGVRETLSLILSKEGCSAETVENGKQAIKARANHGISAITSKAHEDTLFSFCSRKA
jgi:CheY-like chemotaxis protein